MFSLPQVHSHVSMGSPKQPTKQTAVKREDEAAPPSTLQGVK